jgi:hypothetical protein
MQPRANLTSQVAAHELYVPTDVLHIVFTSVELDLSI